MAPSEIASIAAACLRLKASICCTNSRLRVLAFSISSRLSSTPGLPAISRRASSTFPRMAASALLKSCAIPPASVPIASIFWDSTNCASRAMRLISPDFLSVMFSWTTTAPRREPCNGVTLNLNQRFSVGEWQGYSSRNLLFSPDKTAMMPVFAAEASSPAGCPMALSHTSK